MNMNPNTVTKNNLSAITAVKAPISGYFTSVSATKGMYVDAKIYASSDSSLALPTNAVMTIENTSYTLIKMGSSRNNVNLVKVKVKAGQKNEGYVQILNAAEFDEKTEFLTNSAFNLIQE